MRSPAASAPLEWPSLLPAQLLFLNWLPAFFFLACTCRLFWLFLVFFNGASLTPGIVAVVVHSHQIVFWGPWGITWYLVIYVMGFGFAVWLVSDMWSFRKIQK